MFGWLERHFIEFAAVAALLGMGAVSGGAIGFGVEHWLDRRGGNSAETAFYGGYETGCIDLANLSQQSSGAAPSAAKIKRFCADFSSQAQSVNTYGDWSAR